MLTYTVAIPDDAVPEDVERLETELRERLIEYATLRNHIDISLYLEE